MQKLNNPNILLIIHIRLNIIKFLKDFLQQFIDRSLVTIKSIHSSRIVHSKFRNLQRRRFVNLGMCSGRKRYVGGASALLGLPVHNCNVCASKTVSYRLKVVLKVFQEYYLIIT